ncbi:hypothetical protein IQ03_00131 [Gemmobacter caeni]|jgi:hypothetical protein|uniref:Uncharacterized protein n=1 Tax=Gemmobacter caeni TaxID=589035 RepID=A0A2T6BAW9_9RHOB|nr:hypothetical protein C8N34_101133 [Gemmobacter caeni]TWJ05332.1 hypothetical protein IQ03_00131 [Gemmobacter caeni]
MTGDFRPFWHKIEVFPNFLRRICLSRSTSHGYSGFSGGAIGSLPVFKLKA